MENILKKQVKNEENKGQVVMASKLRKIKQRIDRFGNVISEEVIEP